MGYSLYLLIIIPLIIKLVNSYNFPASVPGAPASLRTSKFLEDGLEIRHLTYSEFINFEREIATTYSSEEHKNAYEKILFVTNQFVVAFKIPYHFDDKASKKIWRTFCSGSIIAKDKIITSANCFVETVYVSVFGTKRFRLRSRKLDHVRIASCNGASADCEPSNIKGDWKEIVSIIHRKAFMYPYNDVAIVTSNSPYKFATDISKDLKRAHFINLAFADMHNSSCWTTGYQTIKGAKRADVLDTVTVNIINCEPTLGGSIRVDYIGLFVCAMMTASKLVVDSGSPLVCYSRGHLRAFQTYSKPFTLVGVLTGVQRIESHPLVFTVVYGDEYTDLFPTMVFNTSSRCWISTDICLAIYCCYLLLFILK